MATIGEKIRGLRRSKGLSQEQLGFEINVSRQTVSKWESDAMNPTIDNVKTLCAYFNVAPEYFFDDAAEKTPTACEQTKVGIAEENSKLPNNKKEPLPIKTKILCIGLTILFGLTFLLGALITGLAIYENSQPVIGYDQKDVRHFDDSVVFFGVVLAIVSLTLIIYLAVLLIKRSKRK